MQSYKRVELLIVAGMVCNPNFGPPTTGKDFPEIISKAEAVCQKHRAESQSFRCRHDLRDTRMKRGLQSG
jgi:hypothetical protein